MSEKLKSICMFINLETRVDFCNELHILQNIPSHAIDSSVRALNSAFLYTCVTCGIGNIGCDRSDDLANRVWVKSSLRLAC